MSAAEDLNPTSIIRVQLVAVGASVSKANQRRLVLHGSQACALGRCAVSVKVQDVVEHADHVFDSVNVLLPNLVRHPQQKAVHILDKEIGRGKPVGLVCQAGIDKVGDGQGGREGVHLGGQGDGYDAGPRIGGVQIAICLDKARDIRIGAPVQETAVLAATIPIIGDVPHTMQVALVEHKGRGVVLV